MRQLLLAFLSCLTVCALPLEAQTVRWAINPAYSSIEPMSETLMKVKEGRKSGIVSCSGEVLLMPVADSITSFVEGRALALRLEENQYCTQSIIKEDGEIINIDTPYYVKDYPFFSEGLLPVFNKKGYYGYMNESGELVIPCEYLNVKPFCQGYAVVYKSSKFLGVRVGGDKVLYINAEGKELELDKAVGAIDMGTSFYQGTAVVRQRKGSTYCSIGLDGKVQEMNIKLALKVDWKFRLSTESFPSFDSTPADDGPRVFYEKDDMVGYRASGKVFLPAQFVHAQNFSKGFAVAALEDGRFGLLQLIPGERVSCTQERGEEECGDGMESVVFRFSIPKAFQNDDLTVLCFQEGQPVKTGILRATQSSERIASFVLAQFPRKISVSNNGLIIFTDSYSVLEPEADLEFAIVAVSKRANNKDHFSFELVITNPGRYNVDVPVAMTGKNLIFKQQTVSVPADGKARVSAYFANVIKAESRRITITCGEKTITKSLTVKPIAGN